MSRTVLQQALCHIGNAKSPETQVFELIDESGFRSIRTKNADPAAKGEKIFHF
jgi:hypothetical protein